MIVENGTGLKNADSYVSVEFADSYFSTRGEKTWAEFETTAKEALLIKATDYLEAMYIDKWKSTKLKADQALACPRVGFGVPERLKKAVCELALKANSGELVADVERLTTKEKVGSIEVEYSEYADPATKYAYVLNLLKPYLNLSSGMIVRLERC